MLISGGIVGSVAGVWAVSYDGREICDGLGADIRLAHTKDILPGKQASALGIDLGDMKKDAKFGTIVPNKTSGPNGQFSSGSAWSSVGWQDAWTTIASNIWGQQ